MSAHTPGPWHLSPLSRHVIAASGLPIARMDDLECPIQQREANAHLLAAAPTMLAALQEARKYIQADLDCQIDSHCLKGADGKPDIVTLSDCGADAVAETMQVLNQIDAAISAATTGAAQ